MRRTALLDETVEELAVDQHGAFGLWQLVNVGGTRSLAHQRCRARAWAPLMQGVYALRHRIDDWTVSAGLCLAVPDAVLGWSTAAAWWGFDGVDLFYVHGAVPHDCGSRHRLLRRTDPVERFETVDDGVLRFTDPTRTLVDWAGDLDRAHLELAVESALRAGQTTVERLRWRAEALQRRGRPGPGRVLALLDRRAARAAPTQSAAETLALQVLRAGGVPEPVRQLRVALPGGGTAFLDLAWPGQLVCAEVDGFASHGSKAAFQHDRSRQNELAVVGWTVLRFTWADLTRRPEQVVATVRAALGRSRAS